MKFFSNDAKENTDGPDYDRDRTDVVTSDPVAVPQQRAGSPWTDTPATDAQVTDTDVDRDDDLDGERARVDTDTDAELSEQERRDGTDEDRPATDDRLEAPAQPETDAFGNEPEGAHRADDDETPETDSLDETPAEDDHTIKDEGTFDSPDAVEPVTGEPLAETAVVSDSGADSESGADSGSDSESGAGSGEKADDELNGAPLAVEPEPVPLPSLEPVVAEHETDTVVDDAEDVPVVAAVPVPVAAAATPGSVPAPELDKLFADGADYTERFRDIQFRFVDSPKEATAEAATLVGEAVDKLTAALTAQRDALSGGDTEDTEKLRVELRGYRDLMNRLLAL